MYSTIPYRQLSDFSMVPYVLGSQVITENFGARVRWKTETADRTGLLTPLLYPVVAEKGELKIFTCMVNNTRTDADFIVQLR